MQGQASILDVKLDFAVKSYKNYLNKRIEDDNGKGCYLIDKVPRSDGYVRWSVSKGSTAKAFGTEGGERSFYLHHLAWYATKHVMPIPVVEHLSHLCGDSRCFNPQHLCIENPPENNSRKNCVVAVRCPCSCKFVFWLCKHQPKCIPLNEFHDDLLPPTE